MRSIRAPRNSAKVVNSSAAPAPGRFSNRLPAIGIGLLHETSHASSCTSCPLRWKWSLRPVSISARPSMAASTVDDETYRDPEISMRASSRVIVSRQSPMAASRRSRSTKRSGLFDRLGKDLPFVPPARCASLLHGIFQAKPPGVSIGIGAPNASPADKTAPAAATPPRAKLSGVGSPEQPEIVSACLPSRLARSARLNYLSDR
jgi:hypothetical protein